MDITALPRAVREASEEATRLQAEVAAGNTSEQPAPPKIDPPAPPAAPPAPPAPAGDLAAQLATETQRANRAEAAHKVLQGKFNAEVPALHSKVRELTTQMTELTQRLATPAPAAPAPTTPASTDPSKYLSAEELQEYGPELSSVIVRVSRKVAEETAEARVKPVSDKMQSVETSVKTARDHAAVSASDRFWERFDQLLAAEKLTFDELNNDPEFVLWLQEQDDLSGATRQALLEDAQAKLDAPRAVRFFLTYAKAKKPKPATDPLAGREVPGQGSGGQAENLETGRKWTRDDIRAFYEDVRRGKYADKEAERLRIDKDIAAATTDGRIVG